MTYDKLGRRLRESLDSKKMTANGEATQFPDHATRLEAVKTGYKLYGHLTPTAPVSVSVNQATTIQHVEIRTDLPREELAHELIARLGRRIVIPAA